MEIIIGKTSGFCYGVKNAVEKTKQELEKTQEKMYCLGELVHNPEVVEELKQKGLTFIEDIEEAKGKTIIRAHGIPKETYQRAKEKNLTLIDLTCPTVLKIHEMVQQYAKKGYYLFLIGKKGHPEMVGTYSYAGKNATILEKEEEIEEAIQKWEQTKLPHICILSQTTYDLATFERIVHSIKEKLGNKAEIEVKNTICLATEQRQKETEELAKKVDAMLIIGGKNSSNTNKLYEIAKKSCSTVLFVQNQQELQVEKLKGKEKIGIIAGASTPQKSIDEIISLLEKEKTCEKK